MAVGDFGRELARAITGVQAKAEASSQPGHRHVLVRSDGYTPGNIMSVPPSISTAMAAQDATLTRAYTASAQPRSVSSFGGAPTVYSTNFLVFPTLNSPGGNNLGAGIGTANGCGVEFTTDTDKMELMVLRGTSSRGLMIEVDGQQVQSPSISWTATGSTMYVLLTFTSRSIRHIRVEFDQFSGWRGVNVPPTASVWPIDTRPVVAVVGDSVTAQTGAPLPNQGFACQMGKMLGWDMREVAIGGTGYTIAGTGNKFGDAQRIADVVACNPEVLIIPASTNDNAAAAATISSTVLTTLIAYRDALPRVPIIVGGLFPGSGGPSTLSLANEAAVKEAFDAWADRNSHWVPISTEPDGAWITGTGRVGSTDGTGNSDLYVSSDGVHPSPAGHLYYATRWVRALKAAII